MRTSRTGTAIGIVVLLLLLSKGWAEQLDGMVAGVFDGDTFVLRRPGAPEVRVRLAEIDAPESDQPHGEAATKALARLIEARSVRVDVQAIDDYGRVVGRVYAGDLDVCAAMIESGDAWVFRRYLRDQALVGIEQQARDSRRGLWAQTDPVPPWEWRHRERRREPGCNIKGNINGRGVKIYHVPGGEHYDATRISPGKGERWFCSPEEARAAGWRASRAR